MTKPQDNQAKRRRLDARLDEALRQTFPASDPVSVGHVTATEPPSRPVDAGSPLPRRGGQRRLGEPRRQAGGRPKARAS
jgi:hypothetical protein